MITVGLKIPSTDFVTQTKKTENSTAPATGLFLIYAIHTNPFITPRLAPLAANAPRPPTGRCWSIRIIALWAVSGQTWAFLLSHIRVRCPIIINAYFPPLSRHSTCYFSDPCCRKQNTLFQAVSDAAPLDKNSKSKSHKLLKINKIYYCFIMYKLLAINEFHGIVCHCKRGRSPTTRKRKTVKKTMEKK